MRIGVVGAGQLARMMIPASINLGLDISVFAAVEGSSAKLASTVVGDYADYHQLCQFADTVDIVTFDHEQVPLEHLRGIQELGIAVYPAPEALELTHNKISMRRRLMELDIPQPRWTVLGDDGDRDTALAIVGGFPCVAKLPVGGYDGRGVRIIRSWRECEDWISEGDLLLEELVPFTRELAQLSARRPSGEWVSWPVVETIQVSGVCSEVIASAETESTGYLSEAKDIAQSIAHSVGIVGVLAVELFEVGEGRVVVNELAMRPHNSGHVFTELSVTSQFEQHLRAIADLPLGSTGYSSEFGVMANVFGQVTAEGQTEVWKSYPHAKIHSYQKTPQIGRKAGHVVVVGDNRDIVLQHARAARDILQGAG